MKRAYVDLPHGQVHYYGHGTGKPILLLHQSPSSAIEYRALMTQIGESYRTIAMDTPGYGFSDSSKQISSIQDYASTVADFMAVMGITQACIFGHHTGATIALELATAYPTRVAALVLSSLPFYDPETRQSRLNDPRFAPTQIDPDGRYLMAYWQKFKHDAANASLEDRHRALVNALLAGQHDKESYQAVFHYNESARLPMVTCPSLLVFADQDLFFQRHGKIQALLPGSKTKIIRHGDGLITADRAEELATAIKAFLNDLAY